MLRIQLPRGEWSYDPDRPLGKPGGFGAVFEGTGEGYGPLAVKKLKLEAHEAAHREMKMADDLAGREFAHVIPVLDAGQDAESGSYFVVMPRAEGSLQDELDSGTVYGDSEAGQVLLAIVHGLLEVPHIVHRDLKPGNVLLHDGRWKVADFGIARFVEESTSARTVKGCLTAGYAAPEQWLGERATNATDVYALGCIGYAVLTGRPPFQAPSRADLRHQHLHDHPPVLEANDPGLCSLLTTMLRKLSKSRPSLERVEEVLQVIARPTHCPAEAGFGALARAGATVAMNRLREEAQREFEKHRHEQRERLADEAIKALRSLIEGLFERILRVAPAAIRDADFQLRFGQAKLVAEFPAHVNVVEEGAFARSGWDVVAGAIIAVTQCQPAYTRSASLWHCCLPGEEGYRWREVSYMCPPPSFSGYLDLFAQEDADYRCLQLNQPGSLLDIAKADQAAAPVTGRFQFATKPKGVDDEDTQDFYDRWAALLAEASQGKLQRPRYLPLDH